jgi:hypothetical protein
MNGKIKINARLNRPMFEIRYITADKRKSIVLFGIAANIYGLYFCLYPFIFSVTQVAWKKPIRPTPLTAEELKEVEEQLKKDGVI